MLVLCHNAIGSQWKYLIEDPLWHHLFVTTWPLNWQVDSFKHQPMWGPLVTHCLGKLFGQSGKTMHVTCNMLLNKKQSHSNFNDMCCDRFDSLYPYSIAWFRSSIHGRVLGSRDGSIIIIIILVPSGEISSQSEIKIEKCKIWSDYFGGSQ